MEIVILIAKITVLVAIAGSISAAAYLCVKCQRIKTFAAVDGGYWCAAALLMIAAFYKLDPVHFIEALIAVGPLVFIPGILLLLCVSGRLTRRAVLPIAFAASLFALPVTIYSSSTASCQMLNTIDTCL